MTKLVDEALSKISEVGTIAAMKWLHEQSTKEAKLEESQKTFTEGYKGISKYRINVSKFYETYGWDSSKGYEYYFHIEVSKDGMRGNAETRVKELLAEMQDRFPTPEFEVKGSIEYEQVSREPFIPQPRPLR